MIDIFCDDKTLKKIELKDLSKYVHKKVWIDVTDIKEEEADILKKTFKLHSLTKEDLLTSSSRIKVEQFDNYLFSIFYAIKKEKKFLMTEIDFILGENFLITSHRGELKTISNLKNNKEKLERLFVKGLDFIFHRIIDNEIDNYFDVLEKVDDLVEEIQEETIKNANSKVLSRILDIKQELVKIKKVSFQQREKISFFAKNEYKFISKDLIPYFRDVYDHSIRVYDTIDGHREALANSFDVYMSTVSNNMNEVMKVLSIIATIALPLGVISGIYGTNFDILPGQHFPYGFWFMIFLMFLTCVFMLLFFKRKRWF